MNVGLPVVVLLCFSLLACAGPKPDLTSNSHYQSVGTQIAEADIRHCEDEAIESGVQYGETRAGKILTCTLSGAAVGAIIGAVGGATSGTSGIAALITASVLGGGGFIYGTVAPLQPSPEYQDHVNNCLREKGYEPKGWKVQ